MVIINVLFTYNMQALYLLRGLLVRDQKAAGSNPATSTAKPGCPLWVSRFCYLRVGIPKAQALKRPWGKDSMTASGGNFIESFLNR